MNSLQHRWSFLCRVLDGAAEQLAPLEDIIHRRLIPAISGRTALSEAERILLTFPCRHGGLGVANPTIFGSQYGTSRLITTALEFGGGGRFERTFIDVRVFEPHLLLSLCLLPAPRARETASIRSESPRSGAIHFSPLCALFHRRMRQGCRCTGDPDCTSPVATWEGGVFCANCPPPLQAVFRPAAFECHDFVSAWGSPSLAASNGWLCLPGCRGG